MKKGSELTNAQALRYAREALASVINSSLAINPSYPITLEQMIRHFQSDDAKYEDGASALVNLGKSVYIADLSQRRLDEAMERVAVAMNGNQFPTSQQLHNGILQELDDFDFSLFGEVAIDIGKDLYEFGVDTKEVVKDVGGGLVDTIVSTVKNLKWILLGLVVFILFFINKNSKHIIDKVP